MQPTEVVSTTPMIDFSKLNVPLDLEDWTRFSCPAFLASLAQDQGCLVWKTNIDKKLIIQDKLWMVCIAVSDKANSSKIQGR